jgi:hypothetical protein
MKELTCNTCGESVYLADTGERLEGYETPLEHLDRTGHAARAPVMMACEDCGNVWAYTGDADRPSCSNCRGKRTHPAADD